MKSAKTSGTGGCLRHHSYVTEFLPDLSDVCKVVVLITGQWFYTRSSLFSRLLA
jgi:hypothetical protein